MSRSSKLHKEYRYHHSFKSKKLVKIAIDAIKAAGVNQPTETQVKALMSSLEESIHFIGLSLHCLDLAGDKSPSVAYYQDDGHLLLSCWTVIIFPFCG